MRIGSLRFKSLVALACVSSQTAFGQNASSLNDIPFEPLRGPAAVPLFPEYVWWIISACAIALILFFIWAIRHSNHSSDSVSAKLNPLNVALDSIRSLEKSSGDLEAREFSSAVSEIVRRYIEQACNIPAQEQTTEEFLQSIQN